MKLKLLSREELMDCLVNGILLPETSLIDDNTLTFYFEELENFINNAENDFCARTTDTHTITVSFGGVDYVILKTLVDKIYLLMSPDISDDPEDMTVEEAENVVGLIYGIVVYNEKWEEMSKLAMDLTKVIQPEFESVLKKDLSIDMNKYDEIPNQSRSLELSNIKDFIKKNKKYYV